MSHMDSGDYTYDAPVTDWRRRATELADTLNRRNVDVAQLAARVQELEQELADMRGERDTAIAQMARYEKQRDELRARLDAVPVEAISDFMDRVAFSEEGWPAGYEQERPIIDAWLNDVRFKQQPAQPDDTDAPLTLAAIDDEDGDL